LKPQDQFADTWGFWLKTWRYISVGLVTQVTVKAYALARGRPQEVKKI